MDKHIPSLLEGVGGIMQTIFILVIIAILVFINCTLYLVKNYDINYKYLDNVTLIGISQEKNLLEETVEDYISQIEEKGIMVMSYQLDTEMFVKSIITTKQNVSDNDKIENHIIKHLNIDVIATKLEIENDKIYYFATDTDCNNFVEKVKEYKNIKYNSCGDIVSYKLLTPQNELDSKISELKQEKEEAIRIANLKKEREKAKVTSRGGTVSRSNNSIKVPLQSYVYISSYYGMRKGSMHTGVDFAASAGTEIYAWKSGVITTACWNGGYGNFIEIQHNDGTISRYAHLSKYAVSAGQNVVAGQTIGYVGTTGNSTGNHLHFEIKINGQFVNPLNYL